MAKSSQNGYPVIFSVSGTKNYKLPFKYNRFNERNVRLRGGNSDSAIVLAHFALKFFETIEKPSGTFDLWGWAVRDIRGDDDTSNHASATAIDVNATQHPIGVSGTFTPKQRRKIRRALRNQYNGVIRWGGDYSGRKDEMHFEINASGRKVARVANRLRKTPRGKRILRANGLYPKRKRLAGFRK